MWPKVLLILFLFFMFASLQTSFFLHFNIWGVSPNLIFILFFILIFFEDLDKYYISILWAVVAGFFLDILSYSYFGISIFLLMAIVFLCKKVLRSLSKRENRYPILYFLPLFSIFYLFYEVLSGSIFYLFDSSNILFNFSWVLIIQIFYNLIFAMIGFFMYRFFLRNVKTDNYGLFI